MRTDELDYDLPDAAIAQTPIEPRDSARLLVDRGPDRPADHRHVTDLPGLVRPGDLVVVNTTRVLPARVPIERPTGGAGELLLLEERVDGWWEVLCRPARKLRAGDVVTAVRGSLRFEIGDDLDDGRKLARPVHDGDLLASLLQSGEAPLPPYITQRLDDAERYQTVFSERPASAAAPTAGLHLTSAVLAGVRDAGATVVPVELVVGLDTFRPLSTEIVEDHVIHTERYVVPTATWDAVRDTKAADGRIVAVGTTSVRALESRAVRGEASGRTDLFITPGYRFACVDVLMTNFHLPRSSLLALVQAFVGPRWRDLYAEALQAGYRFLSFGDAMVLERAEGRSVRLTLDIEATDGAARTGTVTTVRGSFATPLFMPVGTRGSIRALMTHELDGLAAADGTRAEIVLGNTYHLMLRPGAEVVAALGGLPRFSGWDGLMLTDSGGYQVFSLDPRVSDEGAEFRSTYDGSTHLLTPETAVATQELLGADIQMVLDVSAPLPSDRGVLRDAVVRTAAWAARARTAHRRTTDQAQFGIVQGGTELDLRRESAERTVALDFDGYAVGGLSVGETRAEMLPALDAALAGLPTDQPRYLMGVGDPVSMVEAVARGVDMFDCVMPTRLARHGTLLTDTGRLNIKRAEFATSDEPIEAGCPCATCRRYSRGYLRHLCSVGEPSAASLCTVHNLTWMFGLVGRVRTAIRCGTLDAVRDDVARVWSGTGPGLTPPS